MRNRAARMLGLEIPQGRAAGLIGPGVTGAEAFWDTRRKPCDSSATAPLTDLMRNGHDLHLGSSRSAYVSNGGLQLPGTAGNYAKSEEEFHRLGVATYVDDQGVVREASDGRKADPKPRDSHYVNGERATLLEAGATNLCDSPIDLTNTGVWEVSPEITVTPNATTAPDGTQSMDLVYSNGGSAFRAINDSIGYTGDGTKGCQVFLKAGDAAETSIAIFDATAGQTRYRITVTWTNGVPSFVEEGSGTVYSFTALSNGIYHLRFSADNVVAANDNRYFLYPAGLDAVAGGVYAWGFQTEDSPFPTSFYDGTRPADNLQFPFVAPPQEMTVYVEGYEQGNLSIGPSGFPRLWEIGSGSERFRVFLNSGNLSLNYQNGLGGNQTTTISSPAWSQGERGEVRSILRSDGSLSIRLSIDGAPEITNSNSTPQTFNTFWADPTLYFNAAVGATVGQFAYKAVKIFAGDRDLDYCRANDGDLFNYVPGDEITAHQQFTGSALSQQVGDTGLLNDAGYQYRRGLRDSHYIDGVRTTLLEKAGTNEIRQSEDFTDGTWAPIRSSVVGGAVIAPDGTTADKIVEDSSDNSHFISQVVSGVVAATRYTYSVYAKAGERSALLLTNASTVFPARTVWFDLINGIVTKTSSTPPDAVGIEAVGDGWYRCWWSMESTGAGTVNLYNQLDISPTGSGAYQGDGVSGLFLWGAQFEEGLAPSSYIKTEGSAVTRNADQFKQACEIGDNQPLTIRVRMKERGTLQQPNFTRVITLLGDGSLVAWSIGDGSTYRFRWVNGSGDNSDTLIAPANYGYNDTLDWVMRFIPVGDGDYYINSEYSVNDGVPVASADGIARTPTVNLNTSKLYLNTNESGTQNGLNAYERVDVYSGNLTFAEAQAAGPGDLYHYEPGDPVNEPSVTGDLEIELDVALADYTDASVPYLLSHYAAAGFRAFAVGINASGAPFLQYSTDGTSGSVQTSTTVLPVSDGDPVSLRFAFELGGFALRFFYRTSGGAWQQLGNTLTGATIAALYNAATDVTVGALGGGATNLATGTISRATIRNGISGETVFDANFAKPDYTQEFALPQGGEITVEESSADTNDPVWLPYCGETYLYLPGTVGDYAVTPDSPELDIDGDFTFIVDVEPDDWAPATAPYFWNKGDFASARGYYFTLLETGLIRVLYSTNGTDTRILTSTVAPPVTGRAQIRVDVVLDNGSNSTGTFFYRTSDSDPWVQFGGVATAPVASGIFANTLPLNIGSAEAASPQVLLGDIYRAQIWNGIEGSGGTKVFDFDATRKQGWTKADLSEYRTNRALVEDGALRLAGISNERATVPVGAWEDTFRTATIRRVEVEGRTTDPSPSSSNGFGGVSGSSGNRGWFIDRNTGNFRFVYSIDGTAQVVVSESIAAVESQADWFAAEHNGDTGVTELFWSEDGETWNSLGTTAGTAGDFFDTTEGFLKIGNVSSASWFNGEIKKYRVIADGLPVVDVDFTAQPDGTLAFADETQLNTVTVEDVSQEVTINRSTSGYKSVVVYDRGVYAFATDDLMEADDAPGLNFGAGEAYTLIGVHRVYAGAAATYIVLGKSAGSTPTDTGYLLAGNQTPQLFHSVQDGTNRVQPTVLDPSAYVGTLLTGTARSDRANATVFANTEQGQNLADPTGGLTNALPFRVGRTSGAGPFYADMEFVGGALFRRALTDAEIAKVAGYFAQNITQVAEQEQSAFGDGFDDSFE